MTNIRTLTIAQLLGTESCDRMREQTFFQPTCSVNKCVCDTIAWETRTGFASCLNLNLSKIYNFRENCCRCYTFCLSRFTAFDNEYSLILSVRDIFSPYFVILVFSYIKTWKTNTITFSPLARLMARNGLNTRNTRRILIAPNVVLPPLFLPPVPSFCAGNRLFHREKKTNEPNE